MRATSASTASRVTRRPSRRGSASPEAAMNLVHSERRGSLAILTLQRPDKLNAINKDMIAELHAALDAVESDEAVRAVVLNGAGRAFSAGFDLDMEVDT